MKLILKENSGSSQVILYQTDDGKTKLQVRLDRETVWLSQNQMAELFQTTKQNVSLHIKNVFSEGELREDAVVKDFLTTASDGKNYQTRHYNLDVIISVGYRVKSLRGTQFRIWATQRLREYIVKGFTMDDERLKQVGGGGYFDPALRGAYSKAPKGRPVKAWGNAPRQGSTQIVERQRREIGRGVC